MMQHPNRVRPSGRTLLIAAVLSVVALLVPTWAGGLAGAGPAQEDAPRPTIVLVHGDWADGSSWTGVLERLRSRGFTVVAPPNPLRGPATDAPYIASFLATIPGPIVLVAHSYGGFVITNAATGNANVKALVYIDAFVPDAGQTLFDLQVDTCIDPNTAFNFVPSAGGVVDTYLRNEANGTYEGFSECFANGVNQNQSDLLHATQRPAALDQFFQPSGPPAWASIPSWSLIGTADRVITPDNQEAMSSHAGAQISTVDAGHLSLITRPNVVAKVIETAVDATT
jgi:pimeloyl-ACP methyl ester carboxylesterase